MQSKNYVVIVNSNILIRFMENNKYNKITNIVLIILILFTGAITAFSMTVVATGNFKLDIDCLLALQSFRNKTNGFFDTFFASITEFGTSYVTGCICIIVFYGIDSRTGLFLFQTSAFGRLVNGTLKLTACIYRPWIRSPKIKPLPSALPGATGYSFPSGHSTNASTVFLGIAYSSFAKKKQNIVYKLLFVIGIAMALLVMFSRIYAGVHTPQDILVGCISSVAVIIIVHKVNCFLGEDITQNYKNSSISYLANSKNNHNNIRERLRLHRRSLIVLVVSVIFTVLCVIYFENKSYPLTYVNGKLLVNPEKMVIDSYSGLGAFLAIALTTFLTFLTKLNITKTSKISIKIITFRIVVTISAIAIFTYMSKNLPSDLSRIMQKKTAYLLSNFTTYFSITFIFPYLINILGKIKSVNNE